MAGQPASADGSAPWALGILGARPLGPQDPAMVGRYRNHAVLGNGGMGRVYLAAAPGAGAGAFVALKVIRPDLAENAEFRRRFARELAAIARVSTPHAAALVHGEPDAEQPWMATEYVPGIALADAISPGNPLPAPAVWRLAHDLAGALTAVHQAGLVHRDVKPGNVILGATGAKVIDFGVAHASDLSQLTATGMNLGTPAYMAPEQAKAGEVSPASDVYSLGVLLYFAASAQLPYGEGGTAEMLFRVVYEEPDLSGLDGLAPDLRDLVIRCMAKTPLQRPPAAGIVAMAEAAALAGAWNDQTPAAVWPEGLYSRIVERTKAAMRTLPDAVVAPAPISAPGDAGTAGAAAASAAVPGFAAAAGSAQPFASSPQQFSQFPPFGQQEQPGQQGQSGHQYGQSAYQMPIPPPPLAPVDSTPTVYTGAGGPRTEDRQRGGRKRRGTLIAVGSAVVVVGLGAAAFALGSPSSNHSANAASTAAVNGGGTATATGPGATLTASATGSATAASASTARSASPSAASHGPSQSTAPGSGGGNGGTVTGPTSNPVTSQPGGVTTPSSPAPTSVHSTTSAPGKPNPYTPTQVCGSGFQVVDSHALSGATIYLLYNSANGDNCVTTMATSVSGSVPMNATLSVQGGSSGSNPGDFQSYAGPVVETAPKTCVEWGGSYQSSSWTSGWSHCG